MSLRQIPVLAVVLALLIPGFASAGNLFLLPPSGSQSNQIQGFSPNLLTLGAVNPPSGTFQVLAAPQGDKVIFISSNTQGPVSFASIVSGQLTGAVRTLTLEGRSATRAVLSPNGERLYVIGGSQPGTLFSISLVGENVLSSLNASIPGTPIDFGISPDGRYAYVLSGGVNVAGQLTVVDLTNAAIVGQITIAGLVNNLAVSPTGRVFVTGQYQLIEFNPRPPFARAGSSQLISSPSRLTFTPDGRYMIAGNLLLNGRSIQVFDTTIAGQNQRGEPGAPAVVHETGLFLPNTTNQQLLFPDEIIILNQTRALIYLASAARILQVSLPNLEVLEASFPNLGNLSNFTSLAFSNEFPGPRAMFYQQGQLIHRYDLTTFNPQGAVNTGPNTGGPLRFAGFPSAGPGAEMYLYGNGQTVGPETVLRPYGVRIVDATGRPVINAPVTFSSSIAGVQLSAANALTNIDGVATVIATSPSGNGEFTVRATAGSLVRDFTSTVTGGTGGGPGDPGTVGPRIIKASGDGQLTQLYNAFTQPLVIRILDGDNNPVAGIPVTWTFSEGVSINAGQTTTVTDSKGEAEMFWIAGGTIPAGEATLGYTMTANTPIGSTTFVATAFPFIGGGFDASPTVILANPPQETRNITVKLGTPQSDEEAVRVQVVTSGGLGVSPGLPIRNVGVRVYTPFTNFAQGPVIQCQGITALTGDNGVALCKIVASGQLGTSDMVVDVGGRYRIFGGIRITVVPGDPVPPVITQGNRQTGKTGETLPVALAARVVDAAGNPLPGAAVSWEVVTPNTITLLNPVTVSDPNGMVSVRVRLGNIPGTHQVRLRVGDKQALFTVTVDPLVTGFALVSGSNQNGIVLGQPFPAPLIVRVTDSNNNPVSGQVVNWLVTAGSATLSASTSTTAADGRASMSVVAGNTPGNITITASVPGQPVLTFNLSSRLPGPGINAASFRNAASNEFGITPGGLIRLYGTGLATGITGERNANILGGRLPLEYMGVRIEFSAGGVSAFAPIYQVANLSGSESVLLQVPFELTGTSATATVTVQGGTTTVTNIPILPASPGVLEDNFANNRRAAVVIRSDGLVVTPETPARRGETLRMYAIGLGQTTPTAETNRVGQPDQPVRATIAVGIDNEGVPVVSAKLAENLIGVYEIVFVVPMTATIGNDRPLGFVMEVVPGQPLYANGSIIAIGPAQ